MIAAGLITGCVTRGKYDELEAERQSLEARRSALAEEVANLQAERDELAAALAATEAEKEVMADTYSELVGELQAEVATGQVQIQQIRDGVRLNVSDELLFESGSVQLGQLGRELIARVANQIKNEDAIVTVEGHTDDVAVGPTLRSRFPTNWELAGARAAIVTRLLAENGVDPARLRAVSRGPFAPLVPNDSAENRAKNRRTEILLRPVPE
jgi:chemotaxis protein MotB